MTKFIFEAQKFLESLISQFTSKYLKSTVHGLHVVAGNFELLDYYYELLYHTIPDFPVQLSKGPYQHNKVETGHTLSLKQSVRSP
jgi:hypothetical protein